MGIFKRKQVAKVPAVPPAREDLRAWIPVISPNVEIEARATGTALCGFKDRPGARKTEIDSIGVEVLDLLNGTRAVETVVGEFADTHKLSFLESRALILSYLKSLVQRGIVTMITPPATSPPDR